MLKESFCSKQSTVVSVEQGHHRRSLLEDCNEKEVKSFEGHEKGWSHVLDIGQKHRMGTDSLALCEGSLNPE